MTHDQHHAKRLTLAAVRRAHPEWPWLTDGQYARRHIALITGRGWSLADVAAAGVVEHCRGAELPRRFNPRPVMKQLRDLTLDALAGAELYAVITTADGDAWAVTPASLADSLREATTATWRLVLPLSRIAAAAVAPLDIQLELPYTDSAAA